MSHKYDALERISFKDDEHYHIGYPHPQIKEFKLDNIKLDWSGTMVVLEFSIPDESEFTEIRRPINDIEYWWRIP